MFLLISLLTLGYLVYLLWEKRMNDRALSSFRYVIHVNGIRGKTSVCRLIDACLRQMGYRVFTKTTGSTPCYIDTNGMEHKIHRLGNANIGEQLRMIRMAHRQQADILILECMAVQPELQKISQHTIVKGAMNVITNVRYDHIFEMGSTLEEIAESLSNTIPRNGFLFTADETFFPFFREKAKALNTEVILCPKNEHTKTENESIAFALAQKLNLDPTMFRSHISSCYEDFGIHKLYQTERGSFLNLFSVNDPQSTKSLLDHYFDDTSHVVFIYNNRADRPDRLLLFLNYFFPHITYNRIIVMGEARKAALRLMRKHAIDRVSEATDWHDALKQADGSVVIGVGHIKGEAYEMSLSYEGGRLHE